MLISVVIPCFNAAPWVGRAVRSVCAQSMPDFEVLVIDDGSTDNGMTVVRNSMPANMVAEGRLRVFSQPNRGAPAARNRGLAEARGDLISFLDADDYWDPDYLTEVNRVFQQMPQAGAVSFNGWFCDPQGYQAMQPPNDDTPRVVPDLFAAQARGEIMIPTSGVTLRVSAVRTAGYMREDLLRSQDSEYWARVAAHGITWVHSRRPLVFTDRTSLQSLSRCPATRNKTPSPETWSRDIWPLISPEQTASFRRLYLSRAKRYCASRFRAGQYSEAKAAARQAVNRAEDVFSRALFSGTAHGPMRLSRIVWGWWPALRLGIRSLGRTYVSSIPIRSRRGSSRFR